jgi:hypothetical protein
MLPAAGVELTGVAWERGWLRKLRIHPATCGVDLRGHDALHLVVKPAKAAKAQRMPSEPPLVGTPVTDAESRRLVQLAVRRQHHGRKGYAFL